MRDRGLIGTLFLFARSIPQTFNGASPSSAPHCAMHGEAPLKACGNALLSRRGLHLGFGPATPGALVYVYGMILTLLGGL